MPDCREMCFHLLLEAEKAIDLLIEAQRECERMYIESEDENSEEP